MSDRPHVRFPAEYYAFAKEPFSVLLETARFDPDNRRSYLFFRPAHVLSIRSPEEVPALFQQIEDCLARGFHLAGFMDYECGYHFERIAALSAKTSPLPLAWFGAYQAPFVFNHEMGEWEGAPPPPPDRPWQAEDFSLHNCRLTIAKEDYFRNIEAIKEYIRDGDTYQVNYTDRVTLDFSGSPVALFAALRRQQRVSYSALLNLGSACILSLSPELFFRRRGRRLVTRPMKGTAPRGKHAMEDAQLACWLQNDDKNRSENVMIVDLLRSDLGRICETGSVRVEELFTVERYETLFQMTSTISGLLKPGLRYYDIFRGLFPSGSVTGAPRIRTMQIIHELEKNRREVYTGAIGFFSPRDEAVFNVAIRSIVLGGGKGEMGVGSGIVYDSLPGQEYAECRLKADFVTAAPGRFQLLEGILWDGEYVFLAQHLERLKTSAEYFGFICDAGRISAILECHRAHLQADRKYKVRLLLDEEGNVTVESVPLEEVPLGEKVALSPVTTSSQDRFLYHKTTRRALYDSLYAEAREQGFAEVIFHNERGEVTEGAISNIFVEREGKLCTPPRECGLLAGIFRQHVLETYPNAREKVLYLADLESADAIYICNSVRGMCKVTLSAAYALSAGA